MSKPNPAKPSNEADKNPAHETGEEHGQIGGPQRTEGNMQKKDLPRGSEGDTRRKSMRR